MKQKAKLLFSVILFIPMVLWAQERSNAKLYETACASCHGLDGKGKAEADVAFDIPLPDFSDCEFASREPDPDWFAIAHQGGKVRAFDRMMPAFGEALTEEEILKILTHIRTFCEDNRWPRGEFNLPRPLFTEKAFPEDEAVLTTDYGSGDTKTVELEFLYEKRFGPAGMVEVAIPLKTMNPSVGDRASGVGDIAVGYKHTLLHNLESGNIFSAGAEIILPTGDENKGFGSGATIFEPFITFGKLLQADMFFQAHAFAEFPMKSGFDNEIGLRIAAGKSWTSGGPFGRAWSPMLEFLSVRDLKQGATTKLDLVPQIQISVNTRQHILFNVGLRVPVTETGSRDAHFVAYLLWDWFDGGFFDGW